MNVVVSHVYDSTRVMLCSGFLSCFIYIYIYILLCPMLDYFTIRVNCQLRGGPLEK